MKPNSTLLALALSFICGLSSAQSETALAPAPSADTKVVESPQIAIAKTFVLFATALEAKKDQQPQELAQCLSFATAEGAPADFIANIQTIADQAESEQVTESIKRLGQALQDNKIDLGYLDIWRKSYHLKFDQMLTLLQGPLGSALIQTEALQPINATTIASMDEGQRISQASAMKAAMLMLYIYNRENNHRTPMEKRVLCAELACNLGAPSIFARLLIGEANPQVNPAVRYDLKEALQNMLQAYGISRVGLRLMGERYELDSKAADKLIAANKIHFFAIHNIIDNLPSDYTHEQAVAVANSLADDLKEMTSLLKGFSSNPHQDQALLQLYALIPSFDRVVDMYHKGDMTFSENLSVDAHENIKVAREALIEELSRLYKDKQNLSPELISFLSLFK